MTQSFVNTGSRQMEVSLMFPLPYDTVIDRMTFLVDGKEYEAKLLDAKRPARRTKSMSANRKIRPCWNGSATVTPRKRACFPSHPGAERKVSLKFSQLLRKDGKLTDLIIPLSTAKYSSSPVEKPPIRAAI